MLESTSLQRYAVGQSIVRDELVHLVCPAERVEVGEPELARVAEEHGVLCIFQHYPTHTVLVDRAVGGYSVIGYAAAGEKGDVCIVCRKGMLGIVTSVCEGLRYHLSSRADGLDSHCGERQGGLCAVGDHEEVLKLRKMREQAIRSGRGIEHDRISVLDPRRGDLGDLMLSLLLGHISCKQRDMKVGGSGAQRDSSVFAVYEIFLFEHEHVAPDGRLADVKLARQLLHRMLSLG